jgi:hypothetical protein
LAFRFIVLTVLPLLLASDWKLACGCLAVDIHRLLLYIRADTRNIWSTTGISACDFFRRNWHILHFIKVWRSNRSANLLFHQTGFSAT